MVKSFYRKNDKNYVKFGIPGTNKILKNELFKLYKTF